MTTFRSDPLVLALVLVAVAAGIFAVVTYLRARAIARAQARRLQALFQHAACDVRMRTADGGTVRLTKPRNRCGQRKRMPKGRQFRAVHTRPKEG